MSVSDFIDSVYKNPSPNSFLDVSLLSDGKESLTADLALLGSAMSTAALTFRANVLCRNRNDSDPKGMSREKLVQTPPFSIINAYGKESKEWLDSIRGTVANFLDQEDASLGRASEFRLRNLLSWFMITLAHGIRYQASARLGINFDQAQLKKLFWSGVQEEEFYEESFKEFRRKNREYLTENEDGRYSHTPKMVDEFLNALFNLRKNCMRIDELFSGIIREEQHQFQRAVYFLLDAIIPTSTDFYKSDLPADSQRLLSVAVGNFVVIGVALDRRGGLPKLAAQKFQ